MFLASKTGNLFQVQVIQQEKMAQGLSRFQLFQVADLKGHGENVQGTNVHVVSCLSALDGKLLSGGWDKTARKPSVVETLTS